MNTKKEKYMKFIVLATRIIAMVSAIGFSSMCISAQNFDNFAEIIKFSLYTIPLNLVTGLYGYVMGMICFVVIYLTLLIRDLEYAYTAVYALVSISMVAGFMMRNTYKTKRGAFLSFIYFYLSTTILFYLIYGMLGLASFSNISFDNLTGGLLNGAMMTFANSILITITLYYLTKYENSFFVRVFLPDVWSDARSRLAIKHRKRTVESHIDALIIVVVCFSGFATAGYVNGLVPNLNVAVINEDGEIANIINDTEVDSDTSDNGDSENSDESENKPSTPWGIFDFDNTFSVSSTGRKLKFQFTDILLAFDIKLVLMIINTAVPLITIASYDSRKSIAEPIKYMAESMAGFTEATASGNNEKRLEMAGKINDLNIHTHDEIQILYEAVNQNAKELNIYLDKIFEEQKLQEELRVAKATSDAKSNFLSNMSHEIRTPINAVLGMDEMILRESNEKNIIKYASDIKSSGKTLLSLVNDILDFSKIEAGKMEIIPVEYELSSVINDLINMIKTKADDKNLELKVNVNPNTPHVLYGDEIRIKQCATNVLSNAVKYTEEGSINLYIDYEQVDAENINLRIRVVDTGIGIKEEDIKKLFSPFERIEEKRNRSIEGTGLGMNIVKQLLALMDSRLEVKSVYGEGSDFSFTVKQKIVKDDPIGDFAETYKKAVEDEGRYVESFHAPEAKILVVDDLPMNLTVIKGLLKPLQLFVDTATSGFEALDKVKTEKYDAIFLDHMMPKMDGIQTRKEMKELEGNLNSEVPCIALTANAVSGAREMYIEAGFDDYLTKPIDSVKFEKLLMQLIPAKKLIFPEDDEFNSDSVIRSENDGVNNDDDNAESMSNEDTNFVNVLKNTEGISYNDAINNCMTLDILKDATRNFFDAIDSSSDMIEEFCRDLDYKEYTVQVHGLKSSARLIGAMDLSEKAAYLEKCGNEENQEEIKEKTPELLEIYRSFKDKLSSLYIIEGEDDRDLIDEDQLTEAYEAIRSFAEVFDFDSADDVISMLENYKIPDNEKERYGKIKEAVRNVDSGLISELLSV